jgi:hypothetical protein
MARKSLPYKEGDWVVVPLSGRYAPGRIARVRKGGLMLVFFFSPRFNTLPSTEDLAGLGPTDAVLVGKVGDLQVLNGAWRVLPDSLSFDPSRWPVPQFGRIESLTGKAYRVTYSESNLLRPISHEECSTEEAASLPQDGIRGWGVIEALLARLLQ